jgi:phosphoribosyl 1,2-cyclic phosphodiesterase
VRIRFLGSGASGGTPGEGRSARQESSAVVDAESKILIDVTRDFRQQGREIGRLDAVLITHAHRDACGGLGALRGWWRERSSEPLRVYASAQTIAALRTRYRRLDHCAFVAVGDGQRRRIGRVNLASLTVPHAREPRFPTFAWRLTDGTTSVVYASDLARLTPELRRFCRGATLLVIDGAMWHRKLFSHLTIDATLPELCDWNVDRIVLTQIGRTAPAHEQLEREVGALCAKAQPAFDRLELRV